MKSKITLTAITLIIAFYADASNAAYTNDKDNDFNQYAGATCAAKKRTVQLQLEYAKQNGHTDKLYGLQKAMDNIQAYCSNDKLYVKYQNKVEDKLESVAKREREIEEAINKGKSEKIEKLSKKLSDEQAQLADAINTLSEFEQEYGK